MKKTNKKSAGVSQSSTAMRLTQRLVDVRRHTTGYVASGKQYTTAQIRQLAKSGRIRGVQVVGNHIQAVPGQQRLTDLPMKIVKL